MNGEERESDDAALELLRRMQVLERRMRLFEAVFLVLLGLIMAITSGFVEGSIVRNFFPGALLGMGVATSAIGIVFVILRMSNDHDK